MYIEVTDNFKNYVSDKEGMLIYNGIISGKQIVVPLASTYPDSCFVEIPEELVPTQEYFKSNSEYAEGNIWDSIQNYGEQPDLSYAFANWSASPRIIPKYPLKDVDKCMYALKDCIGIVDARNLIFHITNENPNMVYVCTNCGNMVYAPKFSFYNAPIVRNYMSMYSGNLKLEKASVYWGDGTTDPITERTACQNMFFKCFSLKDVEFTGEEVGSPLYLDLSYTEVLNYSSVVSLAKSLKTINAVEAEAKGSVHEITLSEATYKLVKGETKVYAETIVLSEIESSIGDVEADNATVLISDLDGAAYIKEIVIEYQITPKEVQEDTQNCYISFHTPFGVHRCLENKLIDTITLTNPQDILTVSEDTEVLDKISTYLVNFSCPCDVSVNIHYNYGDYTSVFANKNWTIKTEVRSSGEIVL